MNPRTEFEKRYPNADFFVYFRFLYTYPKIEKNQDTQEHHICPRKQFPEFVDSPENLITLAVDDHAFAHKLLEAACGIKAPSTTFLEAQLKSATEAGRLGGYTQGRRNKEERKGYCGLTFEQRQAAGRAGGPLADKKNKERNVGFYAPDFNREQYSFNGGQSTKKAHKGIFALDFDRSKAALASNHKRWHVKRGIKSPFCALCQS